MVEEKIASEIPTINQPDLSKEKLAKVIKDVSDINKVEKLKNWYSQYIDHFRNEYEKLSIEEKQCVSNSKNFLKPCQIEVFWIKEPSFQLIIQSNFKDRPDKEIIINGPFNTQEFFEKIRPILNEPRWQGKIERDITFPDSHDTYAEMLASHIHFFVENFKRFLFGHLSGSRYSMGQALENLWAQHYIGNIGESDYKTDVEQIIIEIKDEAKRRESRKNEIIQPSPPQEQKWDGYGVHLFPPVIIGKKTKLLLNNYFMVILMIFHTVKKYLIQN